MPVLHPLKIVVEEQGAVVVNTGYVRAKSKNTMIAEIDLTTKRAEILGYNLNGLILCASQESTNTHPGADICSFTTIKFPQFAGWRVYMAEIGRYTLKLCMTRNI